MKILATGDLHGDVSLAKKLAEKAEKEKVDLVILAGDIFSDNINTENMIGEFVKKKKAVFLIPGNHETVATVQAIAEIYGIRNLHGYSVKYPEIGIGIFGCGGAEVGPHPTLDSQIYKLLKEGFEKVKDMKTKIMVTHVHPKGTKIIGEMTPHRVIKESESESVRQAIEKFKPDIAICSHVHEASGIEERIGKTRIVNVSREGVIFDL